MVSNKFVARFHYRLNSIEGKTRLREHKDKQISYSQLINNRNKLKPYLTFRYKKRSYMFLPEAIRKESKSGLPIINYAYDNTVPNDGKVIAPLEGLDEPQTPEEMKIASDIFDTVYANGEEKSVIAGSQKPKEEWDKKTLIVGALMGGAMTYVITAILRANGIHV